MGGLTVATPARPWNRTHLLTFTAQSSGNESSWTVMLSDTARPSGFRSAPTQSEWSDGLSASWTVDAAGAWRYWGRSTPEGEAGAVRVEVSV
ncbi:MAG: hypothetical protein H0W83_00820 [Planctomycetes bacterium]|nr:hypothetical protein [Planctomycetota bacterium]